MNDEKIPIWIADYVLMGYGTGAIMGVPGARRARSGIRAQIRAADLAESFKRPGKRPKNRSAFVDDGIAINSPIIDGLPTPEAKTKIIAWLEEHGHGHARRSTTNCATGFSRASATGASRSRSSGENGKHDALAESELPLVPPPLDDYKPTGTGEPPLAKAKEWVRYSETATRETNTMPQWAGSCWYYLRFCDPQNDRAFRRRRSGALLDGRTASPAASISTSAAPSTPCCICFTRVSGTRCCSISAISRNRSHSSAW